jgi:hypothetical protein
VKGDIEKSSRIFRDPDYQRTFPNYLQEQIERIEESVTLAKVELGDSVTLIDENPIRVLECAIHLARMLKDSRYEANIRFGGDVGHIEINENHQTSTLRGLSVIRAARIEPHVQPGKIVVSGDFRDTALKDFGDARMKFRRVSRNQLPRLPHESGRFNFAKSENGADAEQAIWTSVYYVTMRPTPSM